MSRELSHQPPGWVGSSGLVGRPVCGSDGQIRAVGDRAAERGGWPPALGARHGALAGLDGCNCQSMVGSSLGKANDMSASSQRPAHRDLKSLYTLISACTMRTSRKISVQDADHHGLMRSPLLEEYPQRIHKGGHWAGQCSKGGRRHARTWLFLDSWGAAAVEEQHGNSKAAWQQWGQMAQAYKTPDCWLPQIRAASRGDSPLGLPQTWGQWKLASPPVPG